MLKCQPLWINLHPYDKFFILRLHNTTPSTTFYCQPRSDAPHKFFTQTTFNAIAPNQRKTLEFWLINQEETLSADIWMEYCGVEEGHKMQKEDFRKLKCQKKRFEIRVDKRVTFDSSEYAQMFPWRKDECTVGLNRELTFQDIRRKRSECRGARYLPKQQRWWGTFAKKDYRNYIIYAPNEAMKHHQQIHTYISEAKEELRRQRKHPKKSIYYKSYYNKNKIEKLYPFKKFVSIWWLIVVTLLGIPMAIVLKVGRYYVKDVMGLDWFY